MPNPNDGVRNSLVGSLKMVPGAIRVRLDQLDPDTKGYVTFTDMLWGKRTTPKRSMFNTAGGGELGTGNCRWRLESEGVEIEPRVGDRIIEPDGTAWIIETVQTGGLSTRYICECVKVQNQIWS